MSFGSMRLYWWQGLGIAIGSVIVLCAGSSLAQITPDGTLPNNSNIRLEGNIRIIKGGTTRGANLFHSFSEFSVPNGSEAFFNNAPNIQNIISRVTGKSISEINGLIKANNTANLFMINPNGIIFGSNAKLDIGGSFLATTASSVKFADDTLFSASSATTNTPLLTISVPIGLQYNVNSGSIQIQKSNLEVNTGKTLALLGGNVSMEGGKLSAVGGRVELGGLAGTGTVGLNFDSNGNLQNLGFPAQAQRADVSLSNQAKVDVTASGGGSIAVNARNIDIFEKSVINAGISENSGSVGTTGGNITLDATGTITLKESSVIQTLVNKGATGSAGNIDVVAGSLYFLSGSQLFTTTFGQGNAGSMNVNARDIVSFDSAGNNASTSGIIASVAQDGVGKGGDINIKTGSVSITNGAQLSAITLGNADAGNVNINTRDRVTIDGANAGASGILTSVAYGAVGKGGNINITTGSLSVTRGAQLNALTLGKGNAGNVSLNVRDLINLDGENPKNAAATAVFSSVADTGIGNGGEIKIDTGSLALTKGAELNTLTNGKGNAGNVSINAHDRIFLDGLNSNGGVSAIFTSVTDIGRGNGGEIKIDTGSLALTKGAELNTLTNGKGNAGNVNINARDRIFLDGLNSNGGVSAIFTSVTDIGRGNGGEIKIDTGSLALTGGAELNTLTKGQGNAGNVNINARDTVSFDGINSNRGSSGIFSSVDTTGVGKGGDIKITTNSLSATNGGGIFASTSGQGDAGNVNINARGRVSFNDARLSTISAANGAAGNIKVDANSINLNRGTLSSDTVGAEGNITLRAKDLVLLRRGSSITTNAKGANVIGGNININTNVLAGVENSDITANSTDFRGGNVRINTEGIFGIQFRDVASPNTSDITATGATRELSGNVQINTTGIDPSPGLLNLPAVPVDTQVAQSCTAGGSQAKSEFIITGRGGLPPNPGSALSTDAVMVDLITLNPEVDRPSTTAVSPRPTSSTPAPIVEAQGWVIDANGNVTLTADAPTVTSHSSWQRTADCHAFNQQQGR